MNSGRDDELMPYENLRITHNRDPLISNIIYPSSEKAGRVADVAIAEMGSGENSRLIQSPVTKQVPVKKTKSDASKHLSGSSITYKISVLDRWCLRIFRVIVGMIFSVETLSTRNGVNFLQFRGPELLK